MQAPHAKSSGKWKAIKPTLQGAVSTNPPPIEEYSVAVILPPSYAGKDETGEMYHD